MDLESLEKKNLKNKIWEIKLENISLLRIRLH